MNTRAQLSSAYPPWAPRFWHGMRLGTWLRLLARHQFRVHPWRLGLASTITALSGFNSLAAATCELIYGRRIRAIRLVEDPVFVIGHWRSGTTYLHELLSCDARFATPTTYQCFAAHHFPLTDPWLPRWFHFVLPAQRPMDNVQAGWNAPQEDEFALCSLGQPSPYLRIAFPNDSIDYLDYLDLRNIDPRALDRWQAALWEFLQRLTFVTGKRLVLKSPTHTARIGLLSDLFPNARFLHIVRHPLSIFPSTMKLWRVLDEAQGLQRPRHDRLREYVLAAFERMYAAFDEGRGRVPPGHLFELRYEDLIGDPPGQLERAYRALDLGEFAPVREPLRAFADSKRHYQTNAYDLPAALRDEILQRWGEYARRYGYGPVEADSRSA